MHNRKINHAPHKIAECVKEKIHFAVSTNPSLTPHDIACGKGLEHHHQQEMAHAQGKKSHTRDNIEYTVRSCPFILIGVIMDTIDYMYILYWVLFVSKPRY